MPSNKEFTVFQDVFSDKENEDPKGIYIKPNKASIIRDVQPRQMFGDITEEILKTYPEEMRNEDKEREAKAQAKERRGNAKYKINKKDGSLVLRRAFGAKDANATVNINEAKVANNDEDVLNKANRKNDITNETAGGRTTLVVYDENIEDRPTFSREGTPLFDEVADKGVNTEVETDEMTDVLDNLNEVPDSDAEASDDDTWDVPVKAQYVPEDFKIHVDEDCRLSGDDEEQLGMTFAAFQQIDRVQGTATTSDEDQLHGSDYECVQHEVNTEIGLDDSLTSTPKAQQDLRYHESGMLDDVFVCEA